jgi:hypothetical protein
MSPHWQSACSLRVPDLDQRLDCTGTNTLGERGKGEVLDTTSSVPQAPFNSALRIVPQAAVNPVTPT